MMSPGPGPQGPPPGISPAQGPGPQSGPPPMAPPQATPSTVPQPAPAPVFHDLPSRLPVGVQLIDGAARQCKKALGTLEFVSSPPERAALLALTKDLDNLITRMTKKTVGKKKDVEDADTSDIDSEDEL